MDSSGVPEDKRADVRRAVLGIDFGTSKTCAAIYRNGKAFMVPNENQERLTPCYVEFTKDKLKIGRSGGENAFRNPENTVYGVKQFLGRNYNELPSQNNNRWDFAIKECNGRPQIQVKTDDMKFNAEEISAMIIGKIKMRAEHQYATEFKQAVISVPAQFNNAQRIATQNAGIIAGFAKVFLVNEPTAVALAYRMSSKECTSQMILVFDLGAGCFDVSVCQVDKGDVRVIATRGDSSFGGDDFDHRMMSYFANLIRKEHDKDIYQDIKAQSRLRFECEKAKIQLSESTTAEIQVEFYAEEFDKKYEITRNEFDEMNEDFFSKIETIVADVLDEACTSSDEIDEVVVVGGSFRILRVEEFLKNNFKKVNKTLNTDEAVAIGAASYADQARRIQLSHSRLSETGSTKSQVCPGIVERGVQYVSAKLTSMFTEDTAEFSTSEEKKTKRTFEDVISRSIYVVDRKNRDTEIIQRNKRFLCDEGLKTSLSDALRKKKSKTGSQFKLREKTSDDKKNFLGTYVSSEDNVTLEIDGNGILLVKKSGEEVDKSIYDKTGSGAPTEKELKKMSANTKKVVEKYRELDAKREAKNDFEKAIYKFKDAAKTSEYKAVLSSEQTESILQKCKEELKWLEGKKDIAVTQYDEKKKELESFIENMFHSTKLKKQAEEKRRLRKARHALLSIIIKITDNVSEEHEIHRKCLIIEDAMESQRIKTREDYEKYYRELEKMWKEYDKTSNATAEAQKPEPMKGPEELKNMMNDISESAWCYQLPQQELGYLLYAQQYVWLQMSGNLTTEPTKNLKKLVRMMKEILDSVKHCQLPLGYAEYLDSVYWSTLRHIPGELIKTREDYEKHCRKLEKMWKEFDETSNTAADAQKLEPKKSLAELKNLMNDISESAWCYELPEQQLINLLYAQQYVWFQMSGNLTTDPTKNVKNLCRMMKEILDLVRHCQLPQNDVEYLGSVYRSTLKHIPREPAPEEGQQQLRGT